MSGSGRLSGKATHIPLNAVVVDDAVVFFPIYFGDSSPTYQGETCTSLCSVFRGLHFAAHFCVLLNQPGSHRG